MEWSGSRIEHRARKLKVQVREIARGAGSCDETFSRPPGPRIACNIRDTRDRGSNTRHRVPARISSRFVSFLSVRHPTLAHARSRHHAIKADRCNMHMHLRTCRSRGASRGRSIDSARFDATRRKSSRGENKRKRCRCNVHLRRAFAFATFWKHFAKPTCIRPRMRLDKAKPPFRLRECLPFRFRLRLA